MHKKAVMVLADGFEEIEAIAPADILNRVGVEVTIASLTEGPVAAAYGATMVPDTTIDQLPDSLYDAIIFPGGKKNARALAGDARVIALLKKHHEAGKIVAAICASPSHVLAESAGILKGRRATGDPGFNEKLAAGGAELTHEHVTIDGTIITAMGPGAAMAFGLTLAEHLVDKATADQWAERWQIGRSQQVPGNKS